MKKRVPESLVVHSYNGHFMLEHTPADLAGVPKADRIDYGTPARYARPSTSEGTEYGSIADVVRGTGKPTIFEQGEALEAVSCTFPIHDAGNRARWIATEDKAQLAKIDAEIEKLRRAKVKAIANAWAKGRPITPDEVRALGEGR